jgi:mannose-6-phosphate isomerase-like protein (cupin superfamily)
MAAICTSYKDLESFITRDGSIIRELIHPTTHGNKNQSFAEATLPAGSSTFHHYHTKSEELYHVIQGTGIIIVGKDRVRVTAGDTVCIPPGIHHSAINTGNDEFKFFCICSPPYYHEETVLVPLDDN